MLLTIARWLFQLPGKLFGLIFKNRLRIFLFFMLVAIAVLGAKRYLRAHQYDDEFSLAAPADYNRAIKREMPLREAREQCGGPLHDNAGQPWPASAGYLHQPTRLPATGLHRLTLDNQDNDFAVLVKLETPAAPQQLAEVFIPPAGSFEVKINADAEHVMKIKNIKTGCMFRSRPFNLDKQRDWRMPLTLHGAAREDCRVATTRLRFLGDRSARTAGLDYRLWRIVPETARGAAHREPRLSLRYSRLGHGIGHRDGAGFAAIRFCRIGAGGDFRHCTCGESGLVASIGKGRFTAGGYAG